MKEAAQNFTINRNWLIFALSASFGVVYLVFFSYSDLFFSPLTFTSFDSNGSKEFFNIIDGAGYLPLDSMLYFSSGISGNHEIDGNLNFFTLLAGFYQNVSLMYIAQFANTILPSNPFYIILLINFMFLVLSIKNYIVVCSHLKLDSNVFLFWISLNLLIVFALFALNKEIIGIYIISEFVLFFYKPARLMMTIRFLLILGLAMITRNVFFIAGIIIFLNKIFKINTFIIFLLFSGIALPLIYYLTQGALLGDTFGRLDQAATGWHQQSAAITTFFFWMVEYPFGYLIQFLIVFAVNVLSPILNPGIWAGYLSSINLSLFMLQISSGLFLILFLKHLRRQTFFNIFNYNHPFQFVLFYSMIFCILPFSQHRYLLCVYPVLVISMLYQQKNS